MIVLVALGAWGLLNPGPGGLTTDSFNPSNVGSQGLVFAVTFSLFLFAGWEGAAPVAEESLNPKRNIPRALMLSVLLAGMVLIFSGWGFLTGFGTERISEFSESPELPAFVLAHQYWHGAGVILLLAVLNSVLVVSLAATMVCTRVLYAFSKAGVAPKWLGKIDEKHHSPVNTIGAVTFLSLVVGSLAGALLGAEQAYFIWGLAITLALVCVYIAGNIAVGAYFRRSGIGVRVGRHVVLPLLTSAALIYVFYKSVHPFPDYPLAAGIWLFVGWALAGGIYSALFGGRAAKADIAALSEEVWE